MADSGSSTNEAEHLPPPPPFVDPSQNSSSPFYIHPSESPSSVVVSPPLTANNFQSWSRSFRMALISKNKMGFLNNTIPVPEITDPLYPYWERCNTLIMSWLLNSLSPSIAQSVVFFERATDVWADLRERFSQGDLLRVAELQEEIYSLQQGALSVTDYYTALKSLWEELDNYRPLAPCSCSARTYHSQDFIIRFLKGLDIRYATVRSQILLLDPLPSATRVFSMVIQNERQHPTSSPSSIEPNPFINTVSGNARGRPQQGGAKQTRKCDFCGRLGHTIDSCFQRNNVTPTKCIHCDRVGHSSDVCYTKYGYPPGHPKYPGKPRPFNNKNGGTVNNVTASSSSDSVPALSYEGERKENPTLGQGPHITVAQFQQLMNLLNKASGSGGGNSDISSSRPNQSRPNQSGFGSRFILSINTTPWIVDSGATDHITTSLDFFIKYSEIQPLNINLPNGSTVQAHISGSIQFSPDFIIHDVLFVPNFNFNLLSLPKLLTTAPCRIIFSNEFSNIICQIQDMNTLRTIGSANLKEGLFHLALGKERTLSTNNAAAATINNSNLWHFRLGHLSSSRLNVLNQQFPFISKDSNEICDVCHLAKQKKLPYTPSSSRGSKIFDLIHMDIWGPFSKVSIHGHKYFLTILDDFSRYTWVVLLKSKGEVKIHIENFINLVENQFETKIKCIRSDNGPEFFLKDLFNSKGIIHQTSCVYTPQQNGRVERKHQHILNVARALMFQSKIPSNFWSYAIKHAVFLINRVPSPIISYKTPFELLNKTTPDFSMIKVFGCLCFASTHNQIHKFEPRSRKGVFLGFQNGTKGYVILDINTRETFVSRNVVFHETVFPFHTPPSISIPFNQPHLCIEPNHDFPDMPPRQISEPQNPNPNPPSPKAATPQSQYRYPPSSEAATPQSQYRYPPSAEAATPQNQYYCPPSSIAAPQPRRSERHIHPPAYLSEYQCKLPSFKSVQSSTRCSHPIQSFLSYTNISPFHNRFLMAISSEYEPASFHQAVKHQCWRDAMECEIKALELNHTWDVVETPHTVHPIGCKWVYKIKRLPDGSIERYKARLVAKGYSQIEGIDYFETFSPVVKMTTVRIVLTLASINHWHLQQLDVSNAFLHGDLVEDVYMEIPPGLSGYHSGQSCKLRKSLYGLKQSSRKWYEKLSNLLLKYGYKQAHADHSLFTKKNGSDFTALLIYVDDIVLTGNSVEEINRIKHVLHSNFHIKDLGKLKYFLGIEVAHSSKGISLCQRKYCLDLLTDTGMLGCKPASTPMDSTLRLHADTSGYLDDPLQYRRLVGRLVYLTNTRPDIAFATQQLSQFMSKPTKAHHAAAIRVLRYLKGCPGTGLFFPRICPTQVSGFSDADWATCVDSRRSITGYCFFIGHSLVSWKTKKQSTVSRSSSEAEYRALASATCELQWIIYLLNDLHISLSQTPLLYCDNASALHIAANPVFHERTKHLDIDCHIVREKSQAGLMSLLPVSSAHQIADIFTKALPPHSFKLNFSKLQLQNIFAPSACGGLIEEPYNPGLNTT